VLLHQLVSEASESISHHPATNWNRIAILDSEQPAAESNADGFQYRRFSNAVVGQKHHNIVIEIQFQIREAHEVNGTAFFESHNTSK
jgi:hypothetical protein